MRRIIASIDIGSDTIKIVVGEIVRSKLNILAANVNSSKGIKKGVIINSELATESIKLSLKKIEEIIGLKINKAIVSVPSYMAEFVIGEGISTITNADNVITGADMVMAMQSSVYNKVPTNMELVTVIPTIFKIDDDIVVKNPKKMIANRLSVKTVIVTTPKKNIFSVLNAVEKAGVKVIDITLGSLGDYYAYKTEEMDELVGAFINIGHETTTVSIFNKGVLTNTEVIDLGSNNIENDLAFIYKISKENARLVKEKLVLCHKRLANAKESLSFENSLGENIKINQYEASEIAMSRISEILNLAKKQINLLTKKEISYIMVTGGSTEAKDFNLVLESIYGKSAKIGSILELGVRNNTYSTSVGLIKYFNDRLNLKDKQFSIFNISELEELVSTTKRVNFGENSVLGKIFGYFFDN